jgi:putative nucleotidyltransferase with HDIG domain
MLPSREQCLKLLEKYGVPEHIVGHSIAVEKVALFLAKKLVEAGKQVDIELVSRASLLHDIDKIRTLETGAGHGILSKQILEEESLPELGLIAFKHHLSHVLKERPFENWEEKLVYYADKRVTHDKVVSLDERFEYLLKRYGEKKEVFHKISACKPKVKQLEEEIFSKIDADKSLEELK